MKNTKIIIATIVTAIIIAAASIGISYKVLANTVVSTTDGKNIEITVDKGTVTLNNCIATEYSNGTTVYQSGDFKCIVANGTLTISDDKGTSEIMTSFHVTDIDNSTL